MVGKLSRARMSWSRSSSVRRLMLISSPNDRMNGVPGGASNETPRCSTSLRLCLLSVITQWSTPLLRMSDGDLLTVFGGDTTRLSVKPGTVQVELDAANPPSSDDGGVTSNIASYQPRQAPSCCDLGNRSVAKLSAIMVPRSSAVRAPQLPELYWLLHGTGILPAGDWIAPGACRLGCQAHCWDSGHSAAPSGRCYACADCN